MPEKRVVSASRISNNRIALYMSSREEVTDAITRGLSYGDSFLELTPLIQPTTRLTFSNVYPEIPNHIRINNISSFCKVVSAVRPIPLGFKNKQLSHVMSFRRQVQVLIKPNITLPDHINCSYCNTNYRVFLSTDSVRCFNRGEFGHISRFCKKTTTRNDPNEPSNPLNPTPIFVHNKSDPKHPPKRTRPSSVVADRSASAGGGASTSGAGGGAGAPPTGPDAPKEGPAPASAGASTSDAGARLRWAHPCPRRSGLGVTCLLPARLPRRLPAHPSRRLPTHLL